MPVSDYQNLLEQCFQACEKVLGQRSVQCRDYVSLQLRAIPGTQIAECIIIINLSHTPWGELTYQTIDNQIHTINFGSTEGLESILWDLYRPGERTAPSVRHFKTSVSGTCSAARQWPYQ